ncbi:MAG: hypothetical protein GXP63_07415 [DPANN group archaeon]|nr:hypothetical protein [DPANN group archaeon]
MFGATMFGAAAADLSDYPRPLFIGDDGTFNGIVVVGDAAAAADVIGAVNVVASLQVQAYKTETISDPGDIALSGDSKKIEQSTDKLELGESLTSTGITSVTESDLAALKSGVVRNEFGDFTYTQYIDLPSNAHVNWTKDTFHDNEVPGDYLLFNTSRAYTYKLTFTPALKSDNDANDRLEDLENKKLTLLGKSYTVVKAEHPAVESLKLTLMGGATEDTLEEYTSKTYNIGGKEYKVEVIAITTTEVKFKVNGEVTDPLTAGETYVLDDGSEIGVRDLMENEGTEEGGADIVTFYLGAKKIVITDTNTSSTTDTGSVQVGSETLANTYAQISTSSDGGLSTGADVTISQLEVYYSPSEELFIAPGQGLSAAADEVEGDSGNVFLDGFDITYEGLQIPKTEDIVFKSSGNDGYKLTFKNKAGQTISEDIVGRTSGDGVFLGKVSGSNKRDLVTSAGTSVDDEDMVVVGDGSEGGFSRILKYKGTQNADNIYKIQDVGSNEIYEVTYDANNQGTLVVDGFSLTITGTGDSSSYINITGDGNSGIKNYLYTQYGAKITLSDSGENAGISIQSETAEDGTSRDTVGIKAYWDTTNSQLDLNSTSWSGIPAYQNFQHGDDDYYLGYASGVYGLFWRYDDPSGSNAQSKASFVYPDDQITAAVFVTSGAVAEGADTGANTKRISVPIPVSASKLASEVSDITAQNAIVIGGPCANPAAADLLGNPANCVSGFTEGKAMIKLFEHANGNVAMLVAGYSAMDTRRATTVVAEFAKYSSELVGDEVEVSGTTLSDISVGAPTVVVQDVPADNPPAE